MHWIMHIIIFSCLSCLTTPLISSETSGGNYRAVRGHRAVIPCGPHTLLDGPGSYIRWIKDERMFLFRYPNVDDNNTDELSLCQIKECSEQTSLVLTNVQQSDAGLYACRIYYRNGPAKDFQYNVIVVDPPGFPVVYLNGTQKDTYIGPLYEGDTINLTCIVHDARDDVNVYWTQDGKKIAEGVRVSKTALLVLVNIHASRELFGAIFNCTAQAGDLTPPLVNSVFVKIILPPIRIQVRSPSKYLEIGMPRLIDCVVTGCFPQPTVTWILGNEIVKNSSKLVSKGNFTISTLKITPKNEDNGKTLRCRAQNEYLSDFYEDSIRLMVGTRPKCVSNDADTLGISEGQSETAECYVESSTVPYRFTWVFADSTNVTTKTSESANLGNVYGTKLVFTAMSKHRGILRCFAENFFGKQTIPCVINVTNGSVPSPPECNVYRTSNEDIKVFCKDTYDGGRNRTFYLELFHLNKSILNTTTTNGSFSISEYRNNLTVQIIAKSERGWKGMYSQSVPEARDELVVTVNPDEPIPWALVFFIIMLSVAGGIVICQCRSSSCRRRRSAPEVHGVFRREPPPDVIESTPHSNFVDDADIYSTCDRMRRPPDCRVIPMHEFRTVYDNNPPPTYYV